MQLKRRLEKLEAAEQSKDISNRVGFEMGWCQKLPPDVGERHMVEVSQLPDGKYEWEERPGRAPADEDDSTTIIRLNLVKGHDGVEVPYQLGDAWRKLAPEEGLPN